MLEFDEFKLKVNSLKPKLELKDALGMTGHHADMDLTQALRI